MGANFQSTTIDARNEKALHKIWSRMIDDLQYEYGHEGYNGTFSTCGHGLSMVDKKFNTRDEADNWLMDNHHKWSPALCVRLLKVKPFQTTALGKRMQEQLTALRAENPRNDEAIEKFHVKWKKAELRYKERKAKGKFPKYAYYIGAWCAE